MWTLCDPSYSIPFYSLFFMSYIYLFHSLFSRKCVYAIHIIYIIHTTFGLCAFHHQIILGSDSGRKNMKSFRIFHLLSAEWKEIDNHYSHLRLREKRAAHTHTHKLSMGEYFGCIRLICCLHLDVPWVGFFCFALSLFAPQAFSG